eukprot:Hpha_TRINITY_DN15802_c0_g9::TRINITY_DN15802_c0_g9_i1::g.188933::m.188933
MPADESSDAGCSGTCVKILNGVFQLLPYFFQYVSMWLLIELLISYTCQESGTFFPDRDNPGPEMLVGSEEHILRGLFDCREMGMPPAFLALFFFLVLLPLMSYQVWAIFRQCRHSRFGTLDYLCYLEVAKEKGSWFFFGLKVQISLVIIITVGVFIASCIVLSSYKAKWQDYIKLLVQVIIRGIIGCIKIPDMIWYDGPVNGKAHARLARYYLKNFYINYSIFADSREVAMQIQNILAMDPKIAEKILIEATYMKGDNRDELQKLSRCSCFSRNKEGDEFDRIADVTLLLEDGVSSAKLQSVDVGKGRGNTLGGGMGHIGKKLLASLGQGYSKTPEDIGEHGEDTVPLRDWAVKHRDEEPEWDEHPRAAAAQRRFFELQWFFRDLHARQGIYSGQYGYDGPSGDTEPAHPDEEGSPPLSVFQGVGAPRPEDPEV